MIGNKIAKEKSKGTWNEDFTIPILPMKMDLLLFFSFCYTQWSHIGQSVAKSQ